MSAKRRKSAVGIMTISVAIVQLAIMPFKSMAQGSAEKYNGEQTICVSDMIHDRLMQEDDQYRINYQEMERRMESVPRGDEAQRMAVYTIPVVVHIIHTGEAVGTGVNITEAQVQSAIDALNEDYRKVPGTNGFGAGVDIEVEFCLASRDPQGNPTNGIVRVNGSSVANYANEGITVGQGSGAVETTVKNLSRWDRDDYYNIWIVNEIEDNNGGAGIQGFAYFPSSSAANDGAVILYNAFGTVGNLKSYTSLNRTATHELGHAFSLYHTFQGNSCSESNCSTEGDRVCDTPPTTTNTSCASPACSGTQQVENYMDYTSQSCMDMFTAGQKTRMRSAISSQRPSLLTSLGCTPPNANDAGIASIVSPVGFSCSGNFAPVVDLVNYGASNLTSVSIKYRVDSGTLQSYSYTGNLPSGAHAQVTLPTISASDGIHTFTAYTQNPNGQTDGYQSNDSFQSDFSVVSGSTVTVSILADNYGTETTWDVKDPSGSVVASGGPYPSGMNGTTFQHEFCLAEGCYDFTIYDSYGDGLCCGGGFGGYEVTDQDGTVLAESGVDFTTYETTEICVGASTNTGTTPIADFSVNQTQGCVGTQFQFSDLSSGAPTTRNWIFQGGSPATSTAMNPVVTFASAGPHNVTLTVANATGSDSEVRSGYITVTTAAAMTAVSTSPSCWNSADGAVNLSLNGGTSPFSYSWNNGANTQDISNLSGGTYTVTLTDAAGCIATATYTLTSPTAINASNTNSSPATCTNNGSATVIPTGGTPAFSYLWNDSNAQTTQTATNLAGGDYTVVITDANGCQKSKTVTVTSSGGVNTTSAGIGNVSCHGGDNGTATVGVSGGSAPYTYAWNDPNGQTTATATNLAAGSYNVQVFDANGCTSTRNFIIAEPSALAVGLTSESAQCNASADGIIHANITGGTSPYTYHWNGAGFGQTLNPNTVTAGTYTFTATDANACVVNQTVTVTEPTAIVATILSTSPDSCQLNVGSAELAVNGGTGTYAVVWNDDDQQEGLILQHVRHGAYMALITDEHSCIKNKTVEIAELECVGQVNEVLEHESFGMISLYPNPLQGQVLTLEFGEGLHRNTKMILMDITGQSVKQMQLPMGSARHHITVEEDVAEGMYLLQLSDGHDTITQRVMVIR